MNGSDFENYRKRYFDTAISDILRAIDGRSLVGAIALALCNIDYLAALRNHIPTGGNRDNYESFVKDYLRSINDQYNERRIYALRCGLVHTYGQADAMTRANMTGFLLNHLNPSFHLSGNDNTLRINLETFVTDIIWATHLFWNDCQSDQSLRQQVFSMVSNLLVVSISNDHMLSRPYESFHSSLRTFDNSSPTRDGLLADISCRINSR